MSRRRWSLRARLALIAGTACAVTAVGVSSTAWLALRQSMLGQADHDLDRIVTGPLIDLTPVMLATLPTPSPVGNGDDLRIQLLDTDGTAHRPPGQPPLPFSAADRSGAAARDNTARYTAITDDGRFRILTVRRPDGRTLQVGRSLRTNDATLRRFELLMAVLAAGAAAAAVVVGRLVARAGLQPVNRLTDAAVTIAATQDLQHPIEVDGNDEIADLAQAFNTMLDAIARVRQAQKRLVEDAAHELCTPMTSLHTNIELLLRAGDRLAGADRDNLLRDLRRQSDDLGALIREIVSLARDDAVDDPVTSFDLADVVTATVERAKTRSPAVQFRLRIAPAPIVGRPAALERMVLNLLDNAVKFGPPTGPIEVEVITTSEKTSGGPK
ncbi:sensor histidine kinase [Actinoplanes sp. CA-030573]|uniref:sensor histidine kinase n=1 Tax=Actinoplanes sp. CA-030573 TaxID=3239898 RepID=UPI003D8E873F